MSPRQPKWNHWFVIGTLCASLLTFGMVWAGPLEGIERAWQILLGKFIGPVNQMSVEDATQAESPIAHPYEQVVDADMIRVGISDNSMEALEYPRTELSATTAFQGQDVATGQTVINAQANQRVAITRNKYGFVLRVQNKLVSANAIAGPIIFSPTVEGGLMQVSNITRRQQIPSYRGQLMVAKGASGADKLSVINIVSLQDYLKAVVPNELPPRYGWEAIKAQAVAARNYALRPREKPWPHFDICDSQYCQVYFGAHTEQPMANSALAETQGLVALYNGEIALALFSSAHGGHSEDYSNSFSDPKTKQFPAPPIAYLKGKPDIIPASYTDLSTEEAARAYWTNPTIPGYDVDSPLNRWTRQWSQAELQSVLTQGLASVSKDGTTKPFVKPLFSAGQTTGTIRKVSVLRRGVSGKAMVVEIQAAKGTWRIEKEFVIRKVFKHGGKMLPSGNVVFSHMTGTKGELLALKANGGGFGHGVGLSQLGASWMSKHGYAYPAIIQHYYQGVALGSLPLKVSGNNTCQPIQTQFYGLPTGQGLNSRMQGTLQFRSSQPGIQVTYSLNGDKHQYRIDGTEASLPVGQWLQPNSLNTFVLYPCENTDGEVRAWVELIAANGSVNGLAAHLSK